VYFNKRYECKILPLGWILSVNKFSELALKLNINRFKNNSYYRIFCVEVTYSDCTFRSFYFAASLILNDRYRTSSRSMYGPTGRNNCLCDCILQRHVQETSENCRIKYSSKLTKSKTSKHKTMCYLREVANRQQQRRQRKI
jgi:hypothetical protein